MLKKGSQLLTDFPQICQTLSLSVIPWISSLAQIIIQCLFLCVLMVRVKMFIINKAYLNYLVLVHVELCFIRNGKCLF